MTTVPDTPLTFSRVERAVMRWLSVPSAPEVPDGSPTSLQIFRAGDKFYAWLVFRWIASHAFAFVMISLATLVALRPNSEPAPWVTLLLRGGALVIWTIFAATLVVTFFAQRLDFRLRWYIVTDRSLRIRSGVFAVREMTMTFRNIQEIRVTAGPIMNALGLANVEVHAAGGGGDPKRGGGGHIGRFEGLANANEIRDLIVARLRQYRDSGLGESMPADVPGHAASHDTNAVAAAHSVLAEARALSASLAGTLR
jgi:membrane protein YdbS with pleckstrin-like domain